MGPYCSVSLALASFLGTAPCLAPPHAYGTTGDCLLAQWASPFLPAIGWEVGTWSKLANQRPPPGFGNCNWQKEVSVSLGVWKWRHVNAEAVGSPVPPCGLRNRKCQSAERESEQIQTAFEFLLLAAPEASPYSSLGFHWIQVALW
jgi:hypothetical protein